MDMKDNPRRRVEKKSVAEQAAEWLMILEEKGEQANPAFADWLRESPTHVQAYLRATTLDTMLRRIDPERSIETPKPATGVAIPDIFPELEENTFDRAAARSFSRRWRIAASLAALTLTLAASWAAFNWVTGPWKTYRTDIGEQRGIELQDGSIVTLNTDSRLQVRFTDNQRSIRLVKGEAIFRVHRDPQRPFRVTSGQTLVQAVGTEFNVYRQDRRTTVSVLEGRVAVIPKTAAQYPPLKTQTADERNIDNSNVYLDAGEELQVTAHGAPQIKSKANLEKVTAWRQRRLIFVDEPLISIGEELNRYNRQPKIRVEGAAAERRYAVSLDADDPESLLAVLSGDPKISVEHNSGEILIRAREAGSMASKP